MDNPEESKLQLKHTESTADAVGQGHLPHPREPQHF